MASYYPPPAFYFTLALSPDDGVIAAPSDDGGFQEVLGIDAEPGAVDGEEGGENRYVHRPPKLAKHANLILKRGYILRNSTLADWIAQAIGSTLATPITKHTLRLSLIAQDGKQLIAWTFVDVWPVKWKVGALNRPDGKILTEELEIAYSSFIRTKFPVVKAAPPATAP